MLAPVLGPLDRRGPSRIARPTAPAPPRATGARSSRRSRRRRRGRCTSTLVERQPELGGDRRAARRSRSASRCARSSDSLVGVPAGVARPCPPSASTRCARSRGRGRAGAGRAAIAASASPTSCTMCAATLPGTSSCTRRVGRRGPPPDPTTARQQLVVDPDPVAGVLGDVAVGRDDHHDRLADVVDLVLGQRVRRAAVRSASGAGSAAAAARPPVPSRSS